MKTLTAVLFLAVSLVVSESASAQTFNITNGGGGAGGKAQVEVPGMAGKVAVIDAICWNAQSTAAISATAVSLAIYNGAVGDPNYAGLALFMTPHGAAGGAGIMVVPMFCTPANMKFTGTAGTDLYAYFNTGVANVAQSITVSGHYE